MSEIRLACVDETASAAVVAEAALVGNEQNLARQDGPVVVIQYDEIGWPLEIAEWAHGQGYATAAEAAEVMATVQFGERVR